MDSPAVPPSRPHAQPPAKADKTDLERFLRVDGPELLRKHAANILLVVLLVAAATMFFYNRSRNKAAEQAATNQNTAIAYDFATQARDLFEAPALTDNAARQRQQKVRDVFNAVDLVLKSDAAAAQKAAAELSKAEVLWLLANAPTQAISTTQPALGFTVRTPADYLADAEAAYADILTKYADQKEYAANALIGLAAIAETRGQFDEAAKRYQQVVDDKSLRAAYHEIAVGRMKMLDDLRLPYALAKPTSQSAAPPATMPTWTSTTEPTTEPTTVPTSIPTFTPTFTPTTRPASMPMDVPPAAP